MSNSNACRLLACCALLVLASACNRLPASGPIVEDVVNEANEENPDIAIYPVTRSFLPNIAHWPETGARERLGWITATAGPQNQVIQAGDMLAIRIWDSSDNSLLTSAEQKDTLIEEVKVAPNGHVFLPYVGQVHVAGKTPDLAREDVQSALEAIVPSAQVLLRMKEGRSNSVDLVGGVENPGAYPMPDRDYSVLSLIAAGGGVSSDLKNPQIRLVRGGRIYGTSVEILLDTPSLDTRLVGGDRVFIEEDTRFFLSFGASGEQDRHTFPRDRVSAMEAISIMGGVNARLADPKGLLILRDYPSSAIRDGLSGPGRSQVVFTIDLTSADGLFSARKFEINSGDLIVATESPINSALTVSNLVGNIFGVFSRAGAI